MQNGGLDQDGDCIQNQTDELKSKIRTNAHNPQHILIVALSVTELLDRVAGQVTSERTTYIVKIKCETSKLYHKTSRHLLNSTETICQEVTAFTVQVSSSTDDDVVETGLSFIQGSKEY
ncbi:hypothetical protein sscle_01g000290 [Sclerotinia sclerotiorum 1980 UF-70]|uniref:Uncharacterized protein n=1 Tax=Sclerotinia sclerotiorum (strain ATCC 18683 / 1980 / Ss-1) TaxID=665079 RepID=A0A1D9PRK7_SCLS1|nr:hypothetical protein sscle_01g000290 [Sclerotinia sclerotiorum 1980 UF-70]